MSSPASRWRAPIIGAVTGLAVAAAIVGPSAFASDGGAGTSPSATTTAPASGIDCAPGPGAAVKRPGGPSEGPGDAPFLAAVTQMVHAGTIDQAQASVLDADIQQGPHRPRPARRQRDTEPGAGGYGHGALGSGQAQFGPRRPAERRRPSRQAQAERTASAGPKYIPRTIAARGRPLLVCRPHGFGVSTTVVGCSACRGLAWCVRRRGTGGGPGGEPDRQRQCRVGHGFV